MKICLGKHVVIVDDEDAHILTAYKWYVNTAKRVVSPNRTDVSLPSTLQLGRLILNAPKSLQVDHINHNTLDNRRVNLRLATSQQNMSNRRKLAGKVSSKFKGVWKLGKRWAAQICTRRCTIFLGAFYDEMDAAGAYNWAARRIHGAFACLNPCNDFTPDNKDLIEFLAKK